MLPLAGVGVCPDALGPTWVRPVGTPDDAMIGGNLFTILMIILVLALIGALPTWGHSRSWGYAPSGGLGLVLLILVILLLMGRI